ncbi:cytochrome c oxidase assembly protein [Halomonas sp. SpR1]|uniref:cytochrome c oxidase assembly protein n=1 Tax=Halomonas sp. SpR1 TaxID=3050462 RepID=UPI0027E49F83|nr:cytochrome c oxidase assembly protein [Halomonas sp. SpR1]MDQ7735102.1 cytochrome c oxidase assembly protein [Halomonas sp. SpR1]
MNGFTLVFSLLAALYSWGWWRQQKQCRRWPLWRLAIFCLAALALMIVLSPPLLQWAHHDFRGHMVVHLIAGMIAPLGLVMAAPVSLALKNVPTCWGQRWVKFVSLTPARLLSHPLTAMVLNIGGMYALYMTDLYAYMLHSPGIALLIHWHFIIAGCLFTWSIAGPDPAPRRPSLVLRFGVLFLSMVTHATLAKWMYQFHLPSSMPIEEVQQGAELMFYIGELVEVVLVYLLVRKWVCSRYPILENSKVVD